MPQTKINSQPIAQPTTCATCPYFESFNEASGRGLCKLFDKVAREHHQRTSDCDAVAKSFEEQTEQATPTEINDRSEEAPDSSQEKDFDSLVGAVKRNARSRSIQVLERHGNKFIVCNIDNGHHYVVDPKNPNSRERCQCGDCHFRGVVCKHQNAVARHQLSATTKVACDLETGDGILLDDRVWQIISISQFTEPAKSKLYDIILCLQLRGVEGKIKVLNPCAEAEFQVVGF